MPPTNFSALFQDDDPEILIALLVCKLLEADSRRQASWSTAYDADVHLITGAFDLGQIECISLVWELVDWSGEVASRRGSNCPAMYGETAKTRLERRRGRSRR